MNTLYASRTTLLSVYDSIKIKIKQDLKIASSLSRLFGFTGQ
jgi:hypothetical protein